MEKDGKREKGNTHVHKHVQIVDGKEQVHDTVLRFFFFFWVRMNKMFLKS